MESFILISHKSAGWKIETSFFSFCSFWLKQWFLRYSIELYGILIYFLFCHVASVFSLLLQCPAWMSDIIHYQLTYKLEIIMNARIFVINLSHAEWLRDSVNSSGCVIRIGKISFIKKLAFVKFIELISMQNLWVYHPNFMSNDLPFCFCEKPSGRFKDLIFPNHRVFSFENLLL